MSASTLIHSAGDERVWAAAAGMRPERGLVLDKDRFYRFAPSTTTYKVTAYAGTLVYFYGTDEHDQSCAVRVSGFRPYLYVSLADVPDTAEGAAVVQRLVAHLQASLLLISACNTDNWSPERQAFSDSLIGAVRQFSVRRGRRNADDGEDDDDNADANAEATLRVMEPSDAHMPIVDWEVTLGRMIKGNGVDSGYRGMHATRFLKLYFYSPHLVSLCRALLHGKYAERGARRQAQLLARRVPRTDATATDAAAGKKGALSALERKVQAARAESASVGGDLTKHYDETGDYDCDSDDDTPAVHGPAQNKDWDSVLDRMDEKLAGLELADIDDSALDDEQLDEQVKEADNELRDQLAAVNGDLHALRVQVKTVEAAEAKAQLERVVRARMRARALEMLREAAPGGDEALPPCDVCEAEIDFVLRVMIDCGFAPEEFVQVDMAQALPTLPNGKPAPTPLLAQQVRTARETRAQIELRCDYRHLSRCDNDALQNKAAKHLTVSLDCEMKTAPDGGFANPLTEQMIQCVFVVRDDHAVAMGRAATPPPKGTFYFRSVSFVLGTVDCRAAPRQYCTGRHILSFADEKTMYRAMARFVTLLDPHIVTGYNSNSFDMPYMKRRAEVLECGAEWSRAWSRSTSNFKTLTITQRAFQSTAAGNIVFSDVRAEGVLFIDVLHQLRKDPMVKLRSYSLNAVAHLYLGASKEDVAYSLINTYNETAAGREKLRSYCEKDALLPLEIVHKRQILISLVEMARINNCPIEVIINRGQQIRCKCALSKAGAKEQPPQYFYTRTQAERDAEANDTYEGAEVVDPTPGLYENPVATLDWESLYPSTQVTHNLDPGTLVQPDQWDRLLEDPHVMRCADPVAELTLEERMRRREAATYVVADMITAEPYTEGPVPRADGSPPLRFLRHTVCVGISVKVQQNYLAHRLRTKKAMKAAELDGDSETEALLNQRQLAIKMLANSLYGMFGATCSFLYAPGVASSVTRRGRAVLYLMRWLAMSEFRQYGTEVVYGDTVGGSASCRCSRARARTRLISFPRAPSFLFLLTSLRLPTGFYFRADAPRQDDRGGGRDRRAHGEIYHGLHAQDLHDRRAAVQHSDAGIRESVPAPAAARQEALRRPEVRVQQRDRQADALQEQRGRAGDERPRVEAARRHAARQRDGRRRHCAAARLSLLVEREPRARARVCLADDGASAARRLGQHVSARDHQAVAGPTRPLSRAQPGPRAADSRAAGRAADRARRRHRGGQRAALGRAPLVRRGARRWPRVAARRGPGLRARSRHTDRRALLPRQPRQEDAAAHLCADLRQYAAPAHAVRR